MLKKVSTVLLATLLLDLFNIALDKIARFTASIGF